MFLIWVKFKNHAKLIKKKKKSEKKMNPTEFCFCQFVILGRVKGSWRLY